MVVKRSPAPALTSAELRRIGSARAVLHVAVEGALADRAAAIAVDRVLGIEAAADEIEIRSRKDLYAERRRAFEGLSQAREFGLTHYSLHLGFSQPTGRRLRPALADWRGSASLLTRVQSIAAQSTWNFFLVAANSCVVGQRAALLPLDRPSRSAAISGCADPSAVRRGTRRGRRRRRSTAPSPVCGRHRRRRRRCRASPSSRGRDRRSPLRPPARARRPRANPAAPRRSAAPSCDPSESFPTPR